ncbi:MAG: hypothetical protein KatS3mg024_2173 [Armatimonadota bacterium]|nr:MAG: hypothetical protein KatS3mg024_2173 [Armatimonadota bacterium]
MAAGQMAWCVAVRPALEPESDGFSSSQGRVMDRSRVLPASDVFGSLCVFVQVLPGPPALIVQL